MPDGANMGLSCGNPSAIAALKQGEVVLDRDFQHYWTGKT